MSAVDPRPQSVGYRDPADILDALRRAHLVKSWTANNDGTYEVLVGRGTVGVGVLHPEGVLTLATDLRRDQVRLASSGYPMGHRSTRYAISDGRILLRCDSSVGRHPDYPYSVLVPGGAPSGRAIDQFAARTQVEALALAGLTRIRGRCTRCRYMRPLAMRDDRWTPDATIRCPGCDADATAAVTLLCNLCKEPIIAHPDPGADAFRSAWIHAVTHDPRCLTPDAHAGRWRHQPQAQLR